ncbi:MAG TPA: ABC transporter ATP-binding protein [Terriglobia bacterium]|nr:ABC transporter ATP-binding protein [Terriglobia bacterium]
MKYFPRIAHYLKPHWRLGALSAGLVLLSALAGLMTPWPLKILVDSVLTSPPAPLPDYLARLLGGGVSTVRMLVLAVIAGVVITILQNAVAVLSNHINTRLDQNIVLDFRTDLFAHIERLSLSFHDRRRAGALIYVLNTQGECVAKMIMAVPQMLQSVLTLIGMFWIAFSIDWQLALLCLTVAPFLYISVGYYMTHIHAELMEVRNMEAESLSIAHETVNMLRVIIAFGREDHELERFRRQGENTVSARVRLTVRQTLFALVVNTATAAGAALVLGVGAYHVTQGALTVGSLLVIMAYIAAVYKPLEVISATIGGLEEHFVNLQCALDVLDTVPEIRDEPHARPIVRAEGRVTFEDVSFSYEGRRDTLKNVSFDVKPGQVIAVAGPTGAGKTTMISLLPRFYAPTSGKILLDGVNITDYTLRSLRSQIGIVLQDPVLFSGSVAANILCGRPDASMDEVMDAARAANAHDFIMKLPDQYETDLGERGSKLSTGERQRIAVARAFLRNAPILILDEPTSSIDSRSESVIIDALERLMAGRTTFIIAHRLSTIRYADLILIVQDGQIVERGSHSELVAARGLYYQLHHIQTSERRSRRDTPQGGIALSETV